jgi:predicted DNA-binding transcriptional regulator AlpA
MTTTILRINDVAERLGVTTATILNWIREDVGFPGGKRLGGARSRRFWLESDIEAWLNRPVTAPKPAKAPSASLPENKC